MIKLELKQENYLLRKNKRKSIHSLKAELESDVRLGTFFLSPSCTEVNRVSYFHYTEAMG